MLCPYCQNEMQHGELSYDRRSPMYFQADGQKLSFFDQLAGTGLVEASKGTWMARPLPADYCPKCKKMIFETEVSK